MKRKIKGVIPVLMILCIRIADKRFYATIVQDSCEYYGELVTMHKTGNLQRCSLGEAPGTAEMGSTNYLWRKGVYINDWRIFG